jgi:hypothetical protein
VGRHDVQPSPHSFSVEVAAPVSKEKASHSRGNDAHEYQEKGSEQQGCAALSIIESHVSHVGHFFFGFDVGG